MGAIEWAGVILHFVSLVVMIGALAYVRHVKRATQRWTSRAIGAGLGEADRMVEIVVAVQRADADRIVAAMADLAASSPWRRPPPPPVTMAHHDRVERPPEAPSTPSAPPHDAWLELPAPPRSARPDITFPNYNAADATIDERTLASERDR